MVLLKGVAPHMHNYNNTECHSDNSMPQIDIKGLEEHGAAFCESILANLPPGTMSCSAYDSMEKQRDTNRQLRLPGEK